ncbi:hypothetical protein FB451DRAFT_1363049 [Mycena latifolia]|nr:hypothetical protein FB451DRAFT_1363049 [Mycena latifolia]
MAPPSDENPGIPAARATRSSSKRKPDMACDTMTDDSDPPAKPVKKKPGPKPKPKPKPKASSDGDQSEESNKPPKKKKTAVKAKDKPKPKNCSPALEKTAAGSDADIVEVVEKDNPHRYSDIVFMVPEAASEVNQRVHISSSTSFDDAFEKFYETIGCFSAVGRVVDYLGNISSLGHYLGRLDQILAVEVHNSFAGIKNSQNGNFFVAPSVLLLAVIDPVTVSGWRRRMYYRDGPIEEQAGTIPTYTKPKMYATVNYPSTRFDRNTQKSSHERWQ